MARSGGRGDTKKSIEHLAECSQGTAGKISGECGSPRSRRELTEGLSKNENLTMTDQQPGSPDAKSIATNLIEAIVQEGESLTTREQEEIRVQVRAIVDGGEQWYRLTQKGENALPEGRPQNEKEDALLLLSCAPVESAQFRTKGLLQELLQRGLVEDCTIEMRKDRLECIFVENVPMESAA